MNSYITVRLAWHDDGWGVFSVEQVQSDFSVLEKQDLVNKDDVCSPV